MRGVRVLVSWVLALFLAAMFLLIADTILFPSTEARNVVFPTLAAKSGFPMWEPTGRFLTGLGHVLAALLMLIPWTRRFGGLLAMLIGLGAVAMHLTWLGVEVPTELGGTTTDSGEYFTLALGLLASAVVLVVVHPGRRKQAPRAARPPVEARPT